MIEVEESCRDAVLPLGSQWVRMLQNSYIQYLMKDSENKHKMHLGASPEIFEYAKRLRIQMTSSESLLWNKLRNRNFHGFKFRRQHPILRYVLDFYCHEAMMGIEIDGDYHNTKYQKFYDKDRSSNLEDYGIKIIRYTNKEVEMHIECVLSDLLQELQKRV